MILLNRGAVRRSLRELTTLSAFLSICSSCLPKDAVIWSRATRSGADLGKGVSQESDAGIDAAVRKIRGALGDDASAPQVIITVPAKGYRFGSRATTTARKSLRQCSRSRGAWPPPKGSA
jgi:DNA-binding response OmpR family regulator